MAAGHLLAGVLLSKMNNGDKFPTEEVTVESKQSLLRPEIRTFIRHLANEQGLTKTEARILEKAGEHLASGLTTALYDFIKGGSFSSHRARTALTMFLRYVGFTVFTREQSDTPGHSEASIVLVPRGGHRGIEFSKSSGSQSYARSDLVESRGGEYSRVEGQKLQEVAQLSGLIRKHFTDILTHSGSKTPSEPSPKVEAPEGKIPLHFERKQKDADPERDLRDAIESILGKVSSGALSMNSETMLTVREALLKISGGDLSLLPSFCPGIGTARHSEKRLLIKSLESLGMEVESFDHTETASYGSPYKEVRISHKAWQEIISIRQVYADVGHQPLGPAWITFLKVEPATRAVLGEVPAAEAQESKARVSKSTREMMTK